MTTETDDMLARRAKFATKMATVLGAVHNIPKSKRNEGQKFNYAAAESVFAMLRPLLASNGIAVMMSATGLELNPASGEKGGTVAHLTLDITLIDTETGYGETSTAHGVGMDYGDKSVPKAYTMAAKYWARTAFLIDLQDDAEAAGGNPKGGTPRAPAPTRQPPAPPVRAATQAEQPPPTSNAPMRTDLAAIRKIAAEKGIADATLINTIGRDYGVETLEELDEASAAILKARLEKAPAKKAA